MHVESESKIGNMSLRYSKTVTSACYIIDFNTFHTVSALRSNHQSLLASILFRGAIHDNIIDFSTIRTDNGVLLLTNIINRSVN